MQSVYPSPFYVMDEVDAALDAHAAERVAEYLLMCSKGLAPVRQGVTSAHPCNQPTAFIVISHKPQVFEQAACLVGVFSYRGSSAAMVAHFEPTKHNPEGIENDDDEHAHAKAAHQVAVKS
mmetsp:Transcript_3394/g.9477  ORF Transcript_3394/g.9477 Transcript_3394/m.9477 type:complete len:121 (-) Transcript_3394:70-432(-)